MGRAVDGTRPAARSRWACSAASVGSRLRAHRADEPLWCVASRRLHRSSFVPAPDSTAQLARTHRRARRGWVGLGCGLVRAGRVSRRAALFVRRGHHAVVQNGAVPARAAWCCASGAAVRGARCCARLRTMACSAALLPTVLFAPAWMGATGARSPSGCGCLARAARARGRRAPAVLDGFARPRNGPALVEGESFRCSSRAGCCAGLMRPAFAPPVISSLPGARSEPPAMRWADMGGGWSRLAQHANRRHRWRSVRRFGNRSCCLAAAGSDPTGAGPRDLAHIGPLGALAISIRPPYESFPFASRECCCFAVAWPGPRAPRRAD